jgi:hypothetical protein
MRVELPADLEIPTCDHCGEEWTNATDGERIDAAAEKAYSAALRAMVVEQIARLADAQIEQQRVEHALGLSHGYLSNLKSGKKDPSPMLVSELVLLAKDPGGRLQELEDFWKRRRSAA